MYSLLRIGGISDQLEKLLVLLDKNHPELNPEINRQNMLVVNLSQASAPEHWVEVADALDLVSKSIDEAGVRDIGLLVDTAFEKKEVPEGGVAIDVLSVTHIALEAMARARADFEATVYPVSNDSE